MSRWQLFITVVYDSCWLPLALEWQHAMVNALHHTFLILSFWISCALWIRLSSSHAWVCLSLCVFSLCAVSATCIPSSQSCKQQNLQCRGGWCSSAASGEENANEGMLDSMKCKNLHWIHKDCISWRVTIFTLSNLQGVMMIMRMRRPMMTWKVKKRVSKRMLQKGRNKNSRVQQSYVCEVKSWMSILKMKDKTGFWFLSKSKLNFSFHFLSSQSVSLMLSSPRHNILYISFRHVTSLTSTHPANVLRTS